MRSNDTLLVPLRPFAVLPHRKWLAQFSHLACVFTLISSPILTAAQQSLAAPYPDLSGTPASWAQTANQNELSIVRSQGARPLRYLQHKVDAKGDTTREVIESRQGNVARLLRRNGHPITVAEDLAERERLQTNLDSPEVFAKHHKRAADLREEALELIPLLPQAMIYNFTDGQPQPKGAIGRQVVLDFHPNPTFRPPTMAAEALTGMDGRVWIDAKSRCITRIDAHVLHPVNFGFGILAKIFPGGTIEFEQTRVATDRWVYSRLEEHLTARVLLVRMLPENTTITSWNFRPMPLQLSYQEATRVLLNMPVPLN